MRISELAKELGIESKVVIAYLDSEGKSLLRTPKALAV